VGGAGHDALPLKMSANFIMRINCEKLPESGGYKQNVFSVLSLRWRANAVRHALKLGKRTKFAISSNRTVV